ALEREEEPGADRIEVAAEDVSVEGVHDHRRPSRPREDRREPAHRSGLRRVRMEDLRALAADHACDADGRQQIAERRDLAAQLVDLDQDRKSTRLNSSHVANSYA